MSGTWASDWLNGDIVTAPEYRKSMGCVADSVLSVAAASFDFTGLPTTYAHLLIVARAANNSGATFSGSTLRFNNDTAANYDYQEHYGTAAGTTANEVFAATSGVAGLLANSTTLFGASLILVPHYAVAAGEHPWFAVHNGKYGTASGNMRVELTGGSWRGTAAINRVTLTPAAGSYAAGSRVSIYVMGS